MIQEGWLFYDDTHMLTLADKVRIAAAHYQQKFSHAPDVCYIHPVAEHEANVDGIKIIPYKGIIENHFWLANEDQRKN